MESCNRFDIVSDVFKENILKGSARKKKGSGTHQRVLPDSKIPSNWHSLLRIDEKKEELFRFLAVETSQIKSRKVILSTYEGMVVSNGRDNVSTLVPCTQEEANTRISLHILNISVSGTTRVLVRTADTDV